MPRILLLVSVIQCCVSASSVDMVEVSGCPLTEEEANIAEYVAERNTRIQGGDIKRQIEAKTYTVDSLSLEIYQWWVQLGLAGQRSSIAQFVQIMRISKAQSPSPSFVNVALGWLRKAFDAATGGQFALIEGAIDKLKAFAQSLEAALEKSAAKPGADFLQAATDFVVALPTQETRQLLYVDGFISAVRNVTGPNSTAALLEAYQLGTNLITTTAPSTPTTSHFSPRRCPITLGRGRGRS